ncbi:Ig-like domain-containing protein [Microbacterium sp.]|uniref:Ig-like domain-containing protein n=1 Tax=Microbacterium sp. TaxID=51671 RepID=UPI003A9214D4
MLSKEDSGCRLARPLAMTAAAAVVAITVGLPVSAYAAAPLDSDVFYATSTTAPYVRAVDPASGTLSDPGLAAATAMNQLGVSRDGSVLVGTSPTDIYRYTAADGSWAQVSRSTGPTVPNTHGAVDPKTGHLFYGGLVGGTLQLGEYDPTTNTIVSATAITITVTGAPGGNGDLAFDGAGNLYVVLGADASSGTYSRLYRVDRAALTSGSGTAVQLGGNINATALNSIAFGKDGYLYVAGGSSNSFVKVDPGTGAIVSSGNLTGGITDLASTSVPRTATVGVDTTGGLIDADDSFDVVLKNSDGDNLVEGATDTGGDAAEGPVAVIPDKEYDISLTPGATTNPDDYTATWTCTDASGTEIASGVGVSGSFTYPGAAESIDCTFVNVPRALPAAADDQDLRNTQGDSVTVAVVGNDTGDTLVPSSVRIVDGTTRVSQLTVPGEGAWNVDAATGAITFTPESGFTGNPTPITYEVSDSRGNKDQAAVLVTYLPIAVDDSDLDNTAGTAVRVPVVGNDTGEIDPTTVRITDPTSGDPVTTLVVSGEGTWTVDPATGDVTFTPETGFVDNPTPITYTVTDDRGETAEAKVTVTYLAAATDDTSLGNEPGAAVTVPVTGNDSRSVVPSTVKITDPSSGDPVGELVVPGEGTWEVDPSTGAITFTPEDGFTGNPTPIAYTGTDGDGNSVEATVTVTYLPAATDDQSLGNVIGTPVTVLVAGNDSDNVDPSTVRITDPATGDPVDTLVVPGEGTWMVDVATGAVTFTPESGFESSPTPVGYTIQDADGNSTEAVVTVGYAPAAEDDQDLGNAPGTPVTVPVVGNDRGDVVPSTVSITDPATGDPVTTLVVPGEGTWSVNSTTGDVMFTPEEGFTGNPNPIAYTIEDGAGQSTTATVTVTYLPTATDDEDLDNTVGTSVTVPVSGNDSTNVDPSTVKITDPATGDPVTTLVVPGEGTWTVDTATGAVTFVPVDGFIGDPTVIDYTITDSAGNQSGASVTITYLSDPTSDEDLGNTIGDSVTVPVTVNDPDGLDPRTVKIIDPDSHGLVTTLVVPGEGTWSVDPGKGDITFAPEKGFEGNPTPIEYVFAPVGQPASAPAKVTIGYDPAAGDDTSYGNTPGSSVTVPVLGNDHGDLDPSTVRIIDPNSGDPVTKLVVPGEGTWTVNLTTGAVTFTPQDGFKGNPKPIDYSVQDKAGKTTMAKVTIRYIGAPALATTGGQSTWGLAGLGALLLGLGGSAFAVMRRRKHGNA